MTGENNPTVIADYIPKYTILTDVTEEMTKLDLV